MQRKCLLKVKGFDLEWVTIFLLFFNDLPLAISSSVDSINASDKSLEDIEFKLNEDCKNKNVSQWMRSNKMKLNPEKTHLITIGTQRRLSALNRPPHIVMDGVPLHEDTAKSELLLGCIVEGNLKWNNQVSKLLEKLKKRVGGLNSIKYICNFSSRKMFAEGIFNSVMVYCLPLFG